MARKTRRPEQKRAVTQPRTLADLQPDDQNARRHTPRNLSMIGDALALVGGGRSLVIDERARILAGNATQRKALERGMRLKVVDGDRNTIVAVRRTDLTPDEKVHLALFDNRAAELAEWDPAVLQALAAAGVDTTALWTDREMRELLAEYDQAAAGLTDPDAVPELRRTDIRVGDLFTLGDHRILCGDSCDPQTVRRLMAGARAVVFATDPPYLVDYTATVKSRKVKARDDEDSSDWDDPGQGKQLFEGFIQAAIAEAIAPTAAWYCWHASRRQAWLEQVWEAAGAFVHQQIVWVKSRAVFGRSVYMWRHELCFFGWIRGKKPQVRLAPLDDGKPTTIWRPREEPVGDLPTTTWLVPSAEIETVEHPTSKPTRLFIIPMLMHSSRGDVCYEPFSGSGSQIIAAQQTGRRCYAIELQPKYVQLAIDRWEAFTGQKAVKVSADVVKAPRRRAGAR
jgi:DNA modification methylase